MLFIYPLVVRLNDRPSTYFWKTDEEHEEAQLKGFILCGIMTYCYTMLVITTVRAWLTNPGEVPQNSDWAMVAEYSEGDDDILEP